MKNFFAILLLFGLLFSGYTPAKSQTTWGCPCVTSTDPEDPTGTKICNGAPLENDGCTCNAYCGRGQDIE